MDREERTARPKVSVSMITYNHERFIAKAIEGVLMQDVDFDIELRIGEDYSTDRTRDIVLSYQKQHPDIIHVSDHGANVGAAENFIRTFRSCTGEYVALLDGDDYWTCPTKLRRQVEYLEQTWDCSLVCHAVTKRFDNGPVREEIQYPWRRQPRYSLADVARWLAIPLSSMMFRRVDFDGFPPGAEHLRNGDWILLFLMARKGEIGYMDEVMGVHWIHEGGIWSMRVDRVEALESNIEMVDWFLENLEPGEEHCRPHYERARLQRYYDLAHAHLDAGDREAAENCFRIASRHGYDPMVYASEPVRYHLRRLSPRLYRALVGTKRLCFGGS